MGIAPDCICVHSTRYDTVKKYTTKSVFKLAPHSRVQFPIRAANTETRELVHCPVRSATKSSSRYPMLTIETEDGYSLRATEDTELWGVGGWVRLGGLQSGDVIWTNGIKRSVRIEGDFVELSEGDSSIKTEFKTKPYMDERIMTKLYSEWGFTQPMIAEALGASERTIRVWIKKLGLQKGVAGALFGIDNPSWKGVDVSKKGGYMRTYALLDSMGLRKGKCSRCDSEENLHIHHKDHDTTNIEEDNLIELCGKCHRADHTGFTVRHIRRSRVTAVYPSGSDIAYNINTEMGNYVASGFIIRGDEYGIKCDAEEPQKETCIYDISGLHTWREIHSQGCI